MTPERRLTGEEVICTFMEPRPKRIPEPFSPWFSRKKWWQRVPHGKRGEKFWRPVPLTLDRLREVEERLTREQWWAYEAELSPAVSHLGSTALGFIHASAAQKIAALAPVLIKALAAVLRRSVHD